MKKLIVKICLHIFVWTLIFNSLEQIPRSGLYTKTIFCFIRNYLPKRLYNFIFLSAKNVNCYWSAPSLEFVIVIVFEFRNTRLINEFSILFQFVIP